MLFREDLKRIADKARAKAFAQCGEPADIIISADPMHVGYLCGYRSVMLDVDRHYRTAVIATLDGAYLVTGAGDTAPALEVMRDPSRIFRYGVFYVSHSGAGADLSALPKSEGSFADALRAAVAAVVKPHHVVGLDAATDWEMQQLKAVVGNRHFEARSAIIKARSVKLPEEIAKMRHAAAITEAGMERAFAEAKEGLSELELSTIISSSIIAGGGIPRFIVVTAGQRSALADAYASASKLRRGDLLRVDIGCTFDGYYADTARTAVIGEAAPDQQQRYQALLQGELAQLDLARAGVTAGELFDVAVNTVRKGALPNYQRGHCGHGLGLAPHEFPTLNPANRDVEIVAGMVLCVETPYYEIGWGGMMVEDIILVQEGGNERLTKMPRELRPL